VLCDEAAQFMTRSDGQDLSASPKPSARAIGAPAISRQLRHRAAKHERPHAVRRHRPGHPENAATRFLLQGSTYDKAVENKILDYSGLLDLLKSVRNNKPNYSKFHRQPIGPRIARLVVDPFSYWINTSAPMRSRPSRRWSGRVARRSKPSANWPSRSRRGAVAYRRRRRP
jgi:conjugal transfer ATP-binding protein TraC